MSKSTLGLRKAGLATLAVTLTLGAGIAGAGTAYAAPTGDLTADSAPKVNQGATNQAAGDLEYVFNNEFTTNTKITFKVDANDCSTQAGIDKAIEYAAAPTAALAKKDDADSDARVPSYTVSLGSSSDACAASGIQDVVTVTLTQPAQGDATDTFALDLSKIAYNVGKSANLGDVTVTAAGYGTDSAVNAVVVNRSFMFVPLVAATPGETGKTLGDATYTETTPGAYFEPGQNKVTLTLSAGTFTADVTPQISVPSGYTVSDATGTVAGAPKTTASNTYVFTVTAPATPVAAKVTVSGLKFNAPGTEQTIELDSTVVQQDTNSHADSAEIVNVVSFGRQHRIGGQDRYETAAAIFAKANFGDVDVVLSGGEKFPDALSANYLAGDLGTGTLLTKRDSLPTSTWNAIIDNKIENVYITGGTAAVSQAIEDKLKATKVGGNVNSDKFINVVRLGGVDRYATNARINNYVGKSSATALLAAGTAPYDSLAGGPVAYKQQYPLVLTDGKVLDSELAQLDRMGANNVVILGGESVVVPDVATELRKDFTVLRLAGATRYSTATAIATWATEGVDGEDADKAVDTSGVAAKQGFTSTTTNITNGLGFADALSAGPLAGDEGSPILLSKNATEVGDDLAAYLGTKEVGTTADGTMIEILRALGLQAATSDAMIEKAAEAIGQ